MKPDLVIFDCDGVIVDSETITCSVIAESLTKYGLPIEQDQVHEEFVGGTIQGIMAEAIERGIALPEDWVTECYDDMLAALSAGVPLSAGFVELIDALEAQGTQVAVASNGAIIKMKTTLGPHGLFKRLEGWMWSGQEHRMPKPEAGMLLAAMAASGADPERTYMIDDSPVGAQAAQAAGVKFFGYIEHGNAHKMEPLGLPLARSMADLHAELVV